MEDRPELDALDVAGIFDKYDLPAFMDWSRLVGLMPRIYNRVDKVPYRARNEDGSSGGGGGDMGGGSEAASSTEHSDTSCSWRRWTRTTRWARTTRGGRESTRASTSRRRSPAGPRRRPPAPREAAGRRCRSRRGRRGRALGTRGNSGRRLGTTTSRPAAGAVCRGNALRGFGAASLSGRPSPFQTRGVSRGLVRFARLVPTESHLPPRSSHRGANGFSWSWARVACPRGPVCRWSVVFEVDSLALPQERKSKDNRGVY